MTPSTSSSLKTTPKDVFLNLMMMVMLYLSIISLITISVAYIDYWYPDQLNFYLEGTLNSIRFGSAMLIITAPFLILVAWLVQKNLKKTPQKHELSFSKWLVYITLFVAAITIVIDLIQLVYRFYGGELTMPFALKVVVILIFTGAVFGYFLWDLKADAQKSKVPATTAWVFSATVLTILVAGFFIVGSPAKQRAMRLDQQRVNDLQNIQYEIVNYWENQRVLPENLEVLQNDITGFMAPKDPETEQVYQYNVLGAEKFELCADFSYPSLTQNYQAQYKNSFDVFNQNWNHAEGNYCFERTIDPALMPKPDPVLPVPVR